MKGYFSKIARQSGLRFSGQDKSVPNAKSTEHETNLVLIHREETVMVPPTLGDSKRKWTQPKSRENPVGREVRTELSNKLEKTSLNPSMTKEMVEVESRSSRRPESSPPPKNTETWDVEAERNAVDDAADPNQPPEFKPIEQIVLKELAQPSPDSESIDERPIATDETVVVPGQTSEQPDNKQFFTKIAQVIETGEVSPQELQTILFREVQQWAADQPEPADIQPLDVGDLVVEKPVEAPVRRIGRPKQTDEFIDERALASDQTQIAEQNLELSIGTITVVIEDDQKPTSVEAPQQQIAQAAAPEPQRFSRLRRSYI